MKYHTKHDQILKELEKVLHKGYSSHQVFEDWLDLMLCALMGEEEKYLEVVRKYPNKDKIGNREIDYFANAFRLLMKAMQETNDEILGELYMQWNMSNKYKGQFFTPKHIAAMMAKMVNPLGRILEPCCGAGIMLVEAIKTMNIEDINQSVFYGQDIDLTCVKMCSLNLTFFNVNGFIIWGDTIKMEVKKVYQTIRTSLGGVVRELTEEEVKVFSKSYSSALLKNGVQETSMSQLQLF